MARFVGLHTLPGFTRENLSSGNWIVRAGSEDEFIARWTDFLQWSRDSADGLGSASLIRAADNPRHFISFAEWDSLESLNAWRSQPDFGSKLMACRALCDDFNGSNYILAASVRGR